MKPNGRYDYPLCTRCNGDRRIEVRTGGRVVYRLSCPSCRGTGWARQESMDPRRAQRGAS